MILSRLWTCDVMYIIDKDGLVLLCWKSKAMNKKLHSKKPAGLCMFLS